MKKSLLFLVLILVFTTTSIAQSPDLPDHSAQIDKDVWMPFVESYENNDGPKFVSLHTDDILRVTKWGIREGQDFLENTLERYAEAKVKRKLNFKFEQRIHSDDTAYEVGYFEIITPLEDGEINKYYGRFSVVLRKVNDVWKIAQDYDTDVINGDPITEADYQKLPAWVINKS